MKKFAIMAAIAISALNFGNVDAAAPVGFDNSAIVEFGPWTSFRDSVTGKRERDQEAKAREEYWREREARERYEQERERQAREEYRREREARERYEQERREREARERYEQERREREARERYQRERTRNDPNYFPPSLDGFRDK